MAAGFEHFDHGADVGVRGLGSTPAEAFEGSAQGLFALLASDASSVVPSREEEFECRSGDLEDLLVAYLNELISLADAHGLVFGRFAVSIEEQGPAGYRLSARCWGEPFDPSRHESTVQPKGATYTALRVEPRGGRWIAQCVVDV
ncbi:MAG: archease [Thermoanaerobaculia bacterium]